MPAVIESTLYTAPLPGGSLVGPTSQNSREDLQLGYHVVLNSVHEATTYSWTLAFASDSPGDTTAGSFGGTGSSSALLPPEGSTSRSASFNVDFEGSYLIRLTTDAGLATESTQFIRLRVLSLFGALKLVSAGERRDEKGVIPVDATPEGWANDQNANFQRIALLLRRHALSGRVLYVDANRGRSSTYDQNDYDNVINIPGTETSRVAETGMRLRAMGHGDFSSINEAITYALDAAGRGEPAPSAVQPYYIIIRPGLYTEDLNLQPHVHLIGDTDFETWTSEIITDGVGGLEQAPVTIRTLNAGGTGTHRFNPEADYNTAKLLLMGLKLETTQDSTQPVLDIQGGLVQLRQCLVYQGGNNVAQGEAIRADVSKITNAAQLLAYDSFIVSNAAGAGRVTLRFNVNGGLCYLSNTQVSAFAVAVEVNEALHEVCSFRAWDKTYIVGNDPVIGYGDVMEFVDAEVTTNGAVNAIDVTPFGLNAGAGAGAKFGDCRVHLLNSRLNGLVNFRSSIAAGSATLEENGVINTAIVAGPRVLLADAPGDLPSDFIANVMASSLHYVTDYHDPLLGPGSPATIAPANQLPKSNVQEAIDLLVQATFPLTGSPFYSLDSAYDGLASLSPFTLGVGLGRTITANGGAVIIQGASYPVATDDEIKNGGLQVEGMVDIGGLINGAGTVLDVGHSEIGLIPDYSGGGPFIGLGRARWLNGVTGPDRGFMGASIVAGVTNNPSAPSSNAPYHLHLRTRPVRSSGTGKAGNVYILAGGQTDQAGADSPGDLHLAAGGNANPAGAAGTLYLVPGLNGTAGTITMVGPGGVNPAFIRFDNPYAGGQAGTLYVGTPSGVEGITFVGTETLGDAVLLVNNTAAIFGAADDGTNLILYSDLSPAGDITIIGDDVGGLLVTALGGTQTFTAGAYGDSVSWDVPVNGRARVLGDLEITGSLIGGGVSGGGGIGSHVILSGTTTHVVAAGEGIFSCEPIGGDIQIDLPDLTANDGRVIVVKLVGGIAPNVVRIQPFGLQQIENVGITALILTPDNGSGLIDSRNQSITLYSDGVGTWRVWNKYTSPESKVYFINGVAAHAVSDNPSFEIYSVILTPGQDCDITIDPAIPPGTTLTFADETGIANAIAAPLGQRIRITDLVNPIDGNLIYEITTNYGSVTIYKSPFGRWKII